MAASYHHDVHPSILASAELCPMATDNGKKSMNSDDGVVTHEQFQAMNWQTPLLDSRKADAEDIADIYAKAAKDAQAAGQSDAERVFWLLFDVSNIVLDTTDRATPFRPRLLLA